MKKGLKRDAPQATDAFAMLSAFHEKASSCQGRRDGRVSGFHSHSFSGLAGVHDEVRVGAAIFVTVSGLARHTTNRSHP
jgi:hypothetical protein